MPSAVADLVALGVALEGHPISGIRYLDGSRVAEARFSGGTGLGVRRTTLHDALRRRLADAEVPTSTTAVREIVDHGDHLLVDGEPTRFLIGADGLHSPVRRLVGLGVPSTSSRRYGLNCHVEIAPWTSFVEVHWARSGEAYVTPVSDTTVGIALLSAERRTFDDLIQDFPALVTRLSGRALSRVRGAGPLRQRTRRRVAGRVLLVGDAAGYVDALTGEGIALGLAQARAAVSAVVDAAPERYEEDWRKLTRRHDLLTRGLVTATGIPVVRQRIVVAARLLPWVFGTAVNQLARPPGAGSAAVPHDH